MRKVKEKVSPPLGSDEQCFRELEKFYPSYIVDSCKKSWKRFWKGARGQFLEWVNREGIEKEIEGAEKFLRTNYPVIRASFVYGFFVGYISSYVDIANSMANNVEKLKKLEEKRRLRFDIV